MVHLPKTTQHQHCSVPALLSRLHQHYFQTSLSLVHSEAIYRMYMRFRRDAQLNRPSRAASPFLHKTHSPEVEEFVLLVAGRSEVQAAAAAVRPGTDRRTTDLWIKFAGEREEAVTDNL